jgi:hypothetical protein
MIERHYGTLLDGAAASITSRLDKFEANRKRELDHAAKSFGQLSDSGLATDT